MIVVAIVAILAAIAYPGYQSYIREARRADAKEPLLRVQIEQERWRTNNATYTCTLGSGGLGLSTTSPGGYYTLSITPQTGTGTCAATGVGYTVKAVAVTGKSQADDTDCTTLFLRSGTHVDATHPEKDPAGCW
jgi:type IV pilus assembly protein PilE